MRLVDGATVTMPDTEENQAAYPQPTSQKPGLGFPICRMVALLPGQWRNAQGGDRSLQRQPKKKPEWMTQEAYDGAPATLKVREFKAGGKVMVTTFLDAKVAPKNALKALYQRCWNVELDLRNWRKPPYWQTKSRGN